MTEDNTKVQLETLRSSIDEVDHDLLQLFQKRMTIVKDIAQLKQSTGLLCTDAHREAQILARVSGQASESLCPYAVAFFRSLMEISKNYQHDLAASDVLAGLNCMDQTASDANESAIFDDADVFSGGADRVCH